MKGKILLVECASIGLNYVKDIIKRGYEPVILEGNTIGSEEEIASYQQVREIKPLHIITGSEFGVMLTVRLAHDLGLLGNPIESLPAMTQKDKMHVALKAHGIRYIHGNIVNSVQEAADFYDEIGAKGIVVKRTRGAAIQGVYLCNNREDILRAVEI